LNLKKECQNTSKRVQWLDQTFKKLLINQCISFASNN
jgi:hypothetical protein